MWKFQKTRLSPILVDKLREAENQLSKLESKAFTVPVSLFRRRKAVVIKDAYLLVAYNNCRPPELRMIFIDSHTLCTAFPSNNLGDFFKATEKLCVTKELEELVSFYLFVHFDHGVFKEGSPPLPIRSREDAHKAGIPVDYLRADIPAGSSTTEITLWWQKWGGILYQVRLNSLNSLVECKRIASRVGSYITIPARYQR